MIMEIMKFDPTETVQDRALRMIERLIATEATEVFIRHGAAVLKKREQTPAILITLGGDEFLFSTKQAYEIADVVEVLGEIHQCKNPNCTCAAALLRGFAHVLRNGSADCEAFFNNENHTFH